MKKGFFKSLCIFFKLTHCNFNAFATGEISSPSVMWLTSIIWFGDTQIENILIKYKNIWILTHMMVWSKLVYRCCFSTVINGGLVWVKTLSYSTSLLIENYHLKIHILSRTRYTTFRQFQWQQKKYHNQTFNFRS